MFVDEFASSNKGMHFFIKNLDEKDYTFENEPHTNSAVVSELPELHKIIIEKMRSKYRRNVVANSKFPALSFVIGSGAGLTQINEDMTTEFLGFTMIAGKSFLGMSKIMLGTSNYDEIMDLASKGNEGNIDTTIGDVISDDPNSPYGVHSADKPIMSMGKAVDLDLDAKDVKREDLASSIVNLMANIFASTMLSAAALAGIDTIYVGGNWVKSAVARKYLERVIADFAGNGIEMISVKYVNTGHAGAIGAMMLHKDDAKKIFHA